MSARAELYGKKILRALVKHPETPYTLHELARLTGLTPDQVRIGLPSARRAAFHGAEGDPLYLTHAVPQNDHTYMLTEHADAAVVAGLHLAKVEMGVSRTRRRVMRYAAESETVDPEMRALGSIAVRMSEQMDSMQEQMDSMHGLLSDMVDAGIDSIRASRQKR